MHVEKILPNHNSTKNPSDDLQEQLKLLMVDETSDVMCVIDSDNLMCCANRAYCNAVGIPYAEIIGVPVPFITGQDVFQ